MYLSGTLQKYMKAFYKTTSLGCPDSNWKRNSQSVVCCHYTTPQYFVGGAGLEPATRGLTVKNILLSVFLTENIKVRRSTN